MVRALIVILRMLSKLPLLHLVFRPWLSAAAVGDGSRAIQRKDYKEALKILSPFAKVEADDVWIASCQWQLGYLYHHGLGVKKDENYALALFQQAARAGDSDAIDYLKRKNSFDRAGRSGEAPQPTL